MRVTTKGQVTIPQHIRKYLNIQARSEVDFLIDEDGNVLLVKLPEKKESKFARFRGILKGQITTSEWMEATRGD